MRRSRIVDVQIDLLPSHGLSKLNSHLMDLTIDHQRNLCNALRNLHAVKLRTHNAATHVARILDRDFVTREGVVSTAVAEHDFVARPRLRQTRIDCQDISV